MITLLPLFLFPFLPQSTRMVEGLLNKDFERLEPNGVIGNTTTPADSGFWINGETRTLTEAAPQLRYLRLSAPASPLPETFVYQRVGVASGLENLTTIDGKVRVGANGREARISLVEPDSEYYAQMWQFQNSPPTPNPWTFLEQNAAGAYSAMQSSGSQVTGGAGSTIDFSFATLGATANSVVSVFTPQMPGTRRVRILVRPWRQSDQIGGAELTQEILKGSGADPSTATLLRSDALPTNDANGREMVLSTDLAPTEKIFLRVRRTTAGTTGTPRVYWHPFAAYEGRKLSYRVGKMLPVLQDTSTEKFVLKSLGTLNTWTTLSSLNGGVALNAGQDFQARFGSAPVGPLELKLSVPSTSTGAADFDDFSCKTGYTSPASEAALRSDILAEARWARTNWAMTVDRGPQSSAPHTAPGAINAPTPFEVHPMKVLSGPTQTLATAPKGKEPYGQWDLLQRAYSDSEFRDFAWIRELELRNPAIAQVGAQTWKLLPSGFDCAADHYNPSLANSEFSATEPTLLLDYYDRTNDPVLLDRAFDYCDLIASNGVITSAHPSRQFMIASEGYSVLDGSNPKVSDPSATDKSVLANYQVMDAPSTLIRAYVACTLFNQSHGTRYSPTRLAAWRTVIAAAVHEVFSKRDVDNPGIWSHAGAWGGAFQVFHGQFNDTYGYVGGATQSAYKSVLRLPANDPMYSVVPELYGASGLLPTQQLPWQLPTAILDGGASWFLNIWEQGVARHELNSGDQARAWPAYSFLIGELRNTWPATSTRMSTQLQNAARNCLKYQYPGAVWTNGGLNPWQLLDTSGGFGGGLNGSSVYPMGLGFALEEAAVGGSLRLDLLAALQSMLNRNRSYFTPQSVPSWSGKGYGYFKNAKTVPQNPDDLAGIEKRSIDNFLFALDHLQAGLPTPPTAAITSPLSFSQPGTQPTAVGFHLDVPTGDAPAALNSRTKIDVWQFNSASGFWEPTNLWPSQPTLFSGPIYTTNNQHADLTLLSTAAFAQAGLKITIRNWDAATDGQWDMDTLVLN